MTVGKAPGVPVAASRSRRQGQGGAPGAGQHPDHHASVHPQQHRQLQPERCQR
jgi:hypothetical protein